MGSPLAAVPASATKAPKPIEPSRGWVTAPAAVVHSVAGTAHLRAASAIRVARAAAPASRIVSQRSGMLVDPPVAIMPMRPVALSATLRPTRRSTPSPSVAKGSMPLVMKKLR